jgi:murein DD-endopeptidase MepM/ murein hydrolase activator NlpD
MPIWKKDRAQVYPGLKVAAGQLIGYSGNTGLTSGPHLHFAIQINKGMTLVSVTFAFLNSMAGKLKNQPLEPSLKALRHPWRTSNLMTKNGPPSRPCAFYALTRAKHNNRFAVRANQPFILQFF